MQILLGKQTLQQAMLQSAAGSCTRPTLPASKFCASAEAVKHSMSYAYPINQVRKAIPDRLVHSVQV